MSKNLSIDALNAHLFEAMEMLKNNKDPKASENEKIDIETAKAIADLAGVVVDGYKVRMQAMQILAKTDNPNNVRAMLMNTGIETENDTKCLGSK